MSMYNVYIMQNITIEGGGGLGGCKQGQNKIKIYGEKFARKTEELHKKKP